MFDKRLNQTVPNSKRWIHTVVLWQWLGLLASIIAAFTFGLCIEGAYYETLTKVQMMYRLMILVCALCARAYCAHMATKASYHASTQVKHHLRTLMYNKLTEMPLSQSQSLKTSSIMQTASEGVEQLEVYFARYVPQFYYSLLAPLTLFLALVCLNFKTALVLLICVPLIPLSIIIVSKIAKRLLGKYWGVYINLGSRFLDNLQGLTTSKIYQDDEYKNNIMNEEAENFRQITMRVLTMQLNSVSIMDLLAYGGSAVGIIIALLEFQTHQLSIAGVVIFILLSSEFFIPLRLLGSFFHIAMNGEASARNIFRLLDTPIEKQGGELATGLDNAFGIDIEHVSFEYNSEKQAIKDINLNIKPKQLTVFVGPSGCGKSTLAHLLMRLHVPQQGEILFNGHNLNNFDRSYLYQHIAIVSHSSYIFKGTIRENLRMAKDSATDEDMLIALEKVNLRHFVEEQNGLDFELQSRGTNLSGGQIQRLALARAILHDAQLYIFDEATSNIDVESEEIILNFIQQFKQDKTIIMISHRLSNATLADQIHLLDQGEIKESGTHTQLMQQKGQYADMFEQQQALENIRTTHVGERHE